MTDTTEDQLAADQIAADQIAADNAGTDEDRTEEQNAKDDEIVTALLKLIDTAKVEYHKLAALNKDEWPEPADLADEIVARDFTDLDCRRITEAILLKTMLKEAEKHQNISVYVVDMKDLAKLLH